MAAPPSATGPAGAGSSDNEPIEAAAGATSSFAPLPPLRALLRSLHRLLPSRRARLERVSTEAEIPVADLRVAGQNRKRGHDYRATPRALVGWALDALPDPVDTATFVDIGSGRGRVVLEAAARPFIRAVGIEFAEELHEDATLNLRHWPRALMRCRDVDFIRADAVTAPLPDGDLVVWMFDPFDERMTFRMAARLADHARSARVSVILVAACSETAFRESSAFTRVEPPRRIALRLAALSPYPVEIFTAGARHGS